MVIIKDLIHESERYKVRMNIAVNRVFGALRVVVPRAELEKDRILRKVAEIVENKNA